jgi:hypothetical protein
LHTPSPTSAQVSGCERSGRSAIHTQLPHAFPTEQRSRRVSAGHRLEDAASESEPWDTPAGYEKEALTGISAGQGLSGHSVAGEGFEPS